jgi:hypothetical protein
MERKRRAAVVVRNAHLRRLRSIMVRRANDPAAARARVARMAAIVLPRG